MFIRFLSLLTITPPSPVEIFFVSTVLNVPRFPIVPTNLFLNFDPGDWQVSSITFNLYLPSYRLWYYTPIYLRCEKFRREKSYCENSNCENFCQKGPNFAFSCEKNCRENFCRRASLSFFNNYLIISRYSLHWKLQKYRNGENSMRSRA